MHTIGTEINLIESSTPMQCAKNVMSYSLGPVKHLFAPEQFQWYLSTGHVSFNCVLLHIFALKGLINNLRRVISSTNCVIFHN